MVQRRLGSSRAAVGWGDVLELQGLTRRYGDLVALDDLSFTVAEGQTFGFIGPNEAGQDHRHAYHPRRADARRRPSSMAEAPMTDGMSKRVGHMAEERGLYPKMRVRDQLEYLARLHGLSRGESHDSAAYWIERLGVAERAGDRVEQLSLGNQQRVQLAAALVHGPELLVLDEPFSGLDPVGVDMLAAVLAERAAEGVPVVFSSHQLELVERLCEAVAIINRGRLVATGKVAELRAAGSSHQYQVGVDGATADWASGLPGTAVVGKANGRVVVELAGGADEQALLDAARRAGRVTHFSAVERTLAELFRRAVQE
jgi:ABC-2 type transport system ATP-binding protein